MSGASTFSPGQRCGPFTIVRSIGKGGYGEVFEAVGGDGERYAVKATKVVTHRDKRAAQRQVLEAKVLQRMENHHIVRYAATDCTADGVYWTAMEFIDGVPLRDILAREQILDVPWVLFIGEQLCAGLRHAHAAGVVHRDIKPDNILITKAGKTPIVKLIDFGIARYRGRGVGTTNIIGTPLYLAPDYIRDPNATDPRWDIYAVGVVLYEALVGRHPYVRDDDAAGPLELPAVLLRALEGDTPPPSSLRRDCPKSVSDCIAKAMACDPADRWPTANELHERLRILNVAYRIKRAGITPPSAEVDFDRHEREAGGPGWAALQAAARGVDVVEPEIMLRRRSSTDEGTGAPLDSGALPTLPSAPERPSSPSGTEILPLAAAASVTPALDPVVVAETRRSSVAADEPGAKPAAARGRRSLPFAWWDALALVAGIASGIALARLAG